MKLSVAAALVSIPDNFKSIGSIVLSNNRREHVFAYQKKYIALRFSSDMNIASKELGYLGNGSGKSTINMIPHSSTFGGPSMISYDPSGLKISECWHDHGVLHRDSAHGPAYIRYNSLGEVSSAEYRNDGRLHRPRNRGPAIYYDQKVDDRKFVGFYEDGRMIASYYEKDYSNIDKSLEFFQNNPNSVKGPYIF